jgi:hypothetical protein
MNHLQQQQQPNNDKSKNGEDLLSFAKILGEGVNMGQRRIQELQGQKGAVEQERDSWKRTAETLEGAWQSEKDGLFENFVNLYNRTREELDRTRRELQRLEKEQAANTPDAATARDPPRRAKKKNDKDQETGNDVAETNQPDDIDDHVFGSDMVNALAAAKPVSLKSNPTTKRSRSAAATTKATKGSKAAPAKKKAASKKAKRMDTPQDVLMRLVEKQGHDLQRIKSEDAGYDTMPSPLQLSSFGTQVVHAVHTSDEEMLGKLLSCGLSPNPCNQFRDSILDLVCKRSNAAIFSCLLEHGADLRVVDGFGRTPLHHCGWASEFCREIAEAILERDPLQLFIEDKRGQTPMEYVRPDLMVDWSEFLEEMTDKFWPKGGTPARLSRPKDSRPDGTLPDPEIAVASGLAAAISSGNVTPEQYAKMDEATIKSYG